MPSLSTHTHSLDDRNLVPPLVHLRRSGLVALLLSIVSTLHLGCVDSDNVLVIKAPVFADCESLNPLKVTAVEYDSAVGATSFTINLNDIQTKGQTVGFDTTTNAFVFSSKPVVTINIAGKNNAQSTTSYTSIGAGAEHRTNQNDLQVKKLKVKVTNNGGLGVNKIRDKSLTATASQGGNFFVNSVTLFDNEEVNLLKQAYDNSGLTNVSFTISVQLEATFVSGHGTVKSTLVPVVVNLCSGSNCTTTPVCSPSK